MNEEIFVRKDLHDANMAEIRALMAASEARHERIAADIHTENEKLRGEFRVENEKLRVDFERLRGDVKALNEKVEGFADTFTVAIQSLKDSISWLGIGIAVMQLALAALVYFLR